MKNENIFEISICLPMFSSIIYLIGIYLKGTELLII